MDVAREGRKKTKKKKACVFACLMCVWERRRRLIEIQAPTTKSKPKEKTRRELWAVRSFAFVSCCVGGEKGVRLGREEVGMSLWVAAFPPFSAHRAPNAPLKSFIYSVKHWLPCVVF